MMSLYIKHAHSSSGPIVMEHIIIRHLFIAWQCLAPGHWHVLFNNAGILQCLPFITLKVENRDQKPLALKHELCRPMTVKRDMSIWIGEKDFVGCPSTATVFGFPTFFKEVLGDWLDDHPLERACSTAGGGGLNWHSRLSPPLQRDLHRDWDESPLRLGAMRNSEKRAKNTCVRRVNLFFVLRWPMLALAYQRFTMPVML